MYIVLYQVLEKAQDEMFDFAKTGCSVMEISHRSAEFKHIISQAEKNIRELWNIPANYKVRSFLNYVPFSQWSDKLIPIRSFPSVTNSVIV